MNQVKERISKLRDAMKKNHMDYYLMVTADPHMSEYVNDYYKEREYFSGFTGSNGTLLIGMEDAYLWTDGRYFVQAEKELEDSDIQMVRQNTPGYPNLLEKLNQIFPEGGVLGLDGLLISAMDGENLAQLIQGKKGRLVYDHSPVSDIWSNDRPADSATKAFLLNMEIAGESASDKIARIRHFMEQRQLDYYLLSKLDDQMWLFNLRGNDIACNPVIYSYTLFTKDNVIFFAKEGVLSGEIQKYLEELHVTCEAYEHTPEYLEKLFQDASDSKIYLDLSATNYRMYQICRNAGKIMIGNNPTELWKAVKNKTEISNSKKTYLMDSVAVTKFIYWVQKEVPGNPHLTESAAADYLDHLRENLEGFMELSFDTISAYGANAAMMHYEAVPGKDAFLKPEGILLVDSGGQYQGGTTDVTRSIILGPISNEIKKQYTHVCMGMLHLMNAVFMKGCTGRNLDALAREPLWELSMDYKCGTGHGIGYILNVHEGPQNITWQKRAKDEPMQSGMIVSDEPGVYVAGSHGIRLETILLCKEHSSSADGEFLSFEPLTYVPIDLRGIDPDEMQPKERDWLNEYHRQVYEKISPYLNEEERDWLKEETRLI